MIVDEYPLVSVRILTYNSSKYVLDTLNSVFEQTYQNIELIISDDCSTDHTVEVCKVWLESHASRFTNVVFLTSPVNTGVCANSKRSLEASSGRWIKGLGADDILYPNAIETFISYVSKTGCEICASCMNYIDEEGNPLNVKLGGRYDDYMKVLELPYSKQYYFAKQSIIVPGPVLFYSRKVYELTGGPNPKYGNADEWSFLYSTLKSGFRIFPCYEALIKYRIRRTSLTWSITDWQSSKAAQYGRLFMKKEILPDLLNSGNMILWWHIYIKYLKWGNANYKFLSLFDILWYYDKFQNILRKYLYR